MSVQDPPSEWGPPTEWEPASDDPMADYPPPSTESVAGPPPGPPAPAPAPRSARRHGRRPYWWVPGSITLVTIGAVIGVTLWQLHLPLLFSDTTTTGGDTGAHIAMPMYLESLLKHGQLTGWDPGW